MHSCFSVNRCIYLYKTREFYHASSHRIIRRQFLLNLIGFGIIFSSHSHAFDLNAIILMLKDIRINRIDSSHSLAYASSSCDVTFGKITMHYAIHNISHGYSRIVVERQRHKQPYAYGRLVNSGSWFFFWSANTSWNMLLQMCRRDLSKKRKVPCVRWFDVFVQFTAVFVVSVYLYQRMYAWMGPSVPLKRFVYYAVVTVFVCVHAFRMLYYVSETYYEWNTGHEEEGTYHVVWMM